MTIRTNDPVHDSAMRDLEYEKWTDSRPTCDVCGQPITDTHYFEYDGEKACPGCWDSVVIENFIRFIEED